MKVVVGPYVEVCKERGLKVSKVMVLDGEERFEYEVHVDGRRLEQLGVF